MLNERAPVDITIDGKDVQLHPLEFGDLDKLTAHMRGQVIRTAQNATQGQDDSSRRDILDAAFRRCDEIAFMGMEMQTFMSTLEGLSFLYEITSKNEVSKEQAYKSLMDKANRDIVSEAILSMLPAEMLKQRPQNGETSGNELSPSI